MPELGRIDRRAAASLAGCAPHPRDSGTTRGRRTVWGGRASLKRALFMAALAARNHDSAMPALFERLVHNGKPNGRHRRRHAQKRRHRKRKSPNHRSPRNRVDDDRGSSRRQFVLRPR
jgi:Transposase IS116/IS110/IS902 family